MAGQSIVKRVKAPLDPETGKPKPGGKALTHFGTGVDARGWVTGWTDKREKAAVIDDDAVAKVIDFYKAKKAADQPCGDVTTEPLAAEPAKK